MSYVNKKNKFSMLLLASLLATNFVFAADSYKNNVVDVKVNKEPGNAVKVTIYTDKPYTDPVVVNKKANNKYVILMPETNSSLKAPPSVSEVTGAVSSVSVNTQSVSGGKGYTKIIITSEKAITVVPRTQQLSSASSVSKSVNIAQQEAQAKKTAELKAQQEKAQKEAQAKKAAELKVQQEKAKKLAMEKAQKEAQAKKTAEVKAQQEKVRRLAQEKAQKEAQIKKAAEIKIQQSTTTNKPNVTHNSNSYNHPIEVLEKEIVTDKTANLSQDISNDSFLKKEINDNLAKQKKTELAEDNTVKPSVISTIKALLTEHENFSLWKLLLLASAITFPVIVIMLILGMDKKINKKIAQAFKKEEPQPMKSDINYIQNEIDNNPTVYTTIDNMLDQVDEKEPSFHEEQIMRSNLEQKLSEVQDTINNTGFENDFESDDFDNDSDVINDSMSDAEEVTGSSLPIEDNVEINNPDKIESVSEATEMIPAQDYSPDGFLADFSNVNDKEFFDEIVIQSLADSNSNGLPDESPEDKIFNQLHTDVKEADKMSTLQNTNNIELQSEDKVVVEKSQNNSGIAENIQPVDDVEHNDNFVENNENDLTDSVKDSEPEKDLVMLNQVEINESAGLYLVDYNNYSSLVGYVNENYFVIKKFNEHITSNIIIKPTEKLENSMRYLVRIGKDKMIVEVGNSSMSRLLDL